MEIKKYYVTGNTAQGFIKLISSNLVGLKQTIKLESPSLKINTAILKRLIDEYKNITKIEVLKSSLSHDYLEGVILREKNTAIIVGQGDRPPVPEFAKGLAIHDELEKVYIQEMDFAKADHAADELIKKLLENAPKKQRNPHTFLRFFGTNTIDGIVNEVPHLISSLDRVYHIKGRAGTGKSTFMKKIANACLAHGLDIELYRCSFDSNSIDMVLVPYLNICLFDSTDPHEFQPTDLTREEVIDLYEIAVTPGTDEKYQNEIAKLTSHYKSYMRKGIEVLKQRGAEIVKEEEAYNISSTELDNRVEAIRSKVNNN